MDDIIYQGMKKYHPDQRQQHDQELVFLVKTEFFFE
jgi:hypothetical protein